MSTNSSSRLSIRDIIWNYPEYIAKFIDITKPVIYILFGLLIGYFIFLSFTSGFITKLFDSKDHNLITEGTVGSLISVNPMYVTQNPVDRDFYELVFEKFIDIDNQGDPLPNLATSWEKTSKLEYVFKIRNDVKWQDGEKLTADDIVWNFQTSIDLAANYGKETYGSALSGVTVEKVDETSVKFVLPEENATFWEAISVYIIPKHKYETIVLRNFDDTKAETKPIGEGPYMVTSITSKGINFEASAYYWKEIKTKKYKYALYHDYTEINNAIKNNEVDIVSNVDMNSIEDITGYPFYHVKQVTSYNDIKLIYFNTRRQKYADKSLREAIYYLIDRDKLIDIDNLQAVPAKGPISPLSWAFNESANYYGYNPTKAAELLKALGYTRSGNDYYQDKDETILTLEITYLQNDENERLIKVIQELLKNEGVLVKVRPLDFEKLTREILATRDFDLLLYQIQTAVDPDQYNLWHSLKIDYPMLNISGYNYSRVDILLERSRKTLDRKARLSDYYLFQKYLMDDAPVIFLYYPSQTFIVRDGLENFNLDNIIYSSDRFKSVDTWYWK